MLHLLTVSGCCKRWLKHSIVSVLIFLYFVFFVLCVCLWQSFVLNVLSFCCVFATKSNGKFMFQVGCKTLSVLTCAVTLDECFVIVSLFQLSAE